MWGILPMARPPHSSTRSVRIGVCGGGGGGWVWVAECGCMSLCGYMSLCGCMSLCGVCVGVGVDGGVCVCVY